MGDPITKLAQLAKELGISPRTARRWRDRGMPQEDDGTWDLERCREFMWDGDGRRPAGDSTEWENRGDRLHGAKATKIGQPAQNAKRKKVAKRRAGKKAAKKRGKKTTGDSRKRFQEPAAPPPEEPPPTTLQEKQLELAESTGRYRNVKTVLAELELAERMGALISFDDVQRSVRDRILEVRAILLSLPPMLAPELEGLNQREIASRLTEEMYRVLEAMARRDKVSPQGFDLNGKR